MGVIVDTCIWIDVERGTVSPADVARYTKDEPVFISPVTIAELSYGSEVAASEPIRQKRLAALQRMKNKPSLHIDGETGVIFGSMSAYLKKAGRAANYRIQDVWIGSQAIQYGYRLLTRNHSDFQDLPGLELIVFDAPGRQ
jgi:predicted nucleic acid-binding protein